MLDGLLEHQGISAVPEQMEAFEAMGIRSIRQLDYVILLCNDIERARAFYRDVMQFPLDGDQETWVKFRVGSGFLTLRPRGQWRAWHDGAAVPGSAAVQLAFRVAPDEVGRCHAELVERGVEKANR